MKKTKAEKRTPLTPRLLILSGRIWGYCREHCDSCHADIHGRVVHEYLRQAVEIVVDDRAQVVIQLRAISTAFRDLRREVAKGEKNDFGEWIESKVGQGHAHRVGATRVTSLQAAFRAGARINSPKPKPKAPLLGANLRATRPVVPDSDDTNKQEIEPNG